MGFKSEIDVTWKDIKPGAIVTEPGSASQYKTGGWRSIWPSYDNSKCNKCGLCFLFCPEGCVEQQPDGYYKVDLDYCKGCGICAKECPKDVISMLQEES